MEEDLLDPVFDDMDMTNDADKRKFFEVCRNTAGRRARDNGRRIVFQHWKAYVSLVLQMGFVNLYDDNICSVLSHYGGGMSIARSDEQGQIRLLDIHSERNLLHPPEYTKQDKIGRILDVLCTSDFCCGVLDTLLGLRFSGSDYNLLNGYHLEMLLFQVIPKFQNLNYLGLIRTSKYASLKGIADRIKSDKNSCTISKSLRRLIFFSEFRRMDREEAAAILTFLKTFVTVERIELSHNYCFDPATKFPSEWKYGLITNMVGRRLLEGNSLLDDDGDGISSLPLSIWPIILQRAQREIGAGDFSCQSLRWQCSKRSEKATGIYYLLREGPALIGRNDLVRNRPKTDAKNHNERFIH